jgi:hypothetical protein
MWIISSIEAASAIKAILNHLGIWLIRSGRHRKSLPTNIT